MKYLYTVPIIVLISFLSYSAFSSGVRQIQITSTTINDSTQSREKMITQVLNSSGFYPYSNYSLGITIDHTLVEPRGRIKGRAISLSSSVVRDSEFLKLFIHELGHFVDIYVFNNLLNKDVSQDFYAISWQNPTTKRAWQKQQNFVSGYSATSQYEDFAESFVFYIFHNRVFEERALRDDMVRQKYLFFQTYVFPQWTFTDTDFSVGKIPSYTWDTTKLPISLQKYLYSLN